MWFDKDVIASVGVVFGGGFAFYKYVVERREDRQQRVNELEQRREEFRWRQGQTAKSLLDELFEDKLVNDSLDMLDSWGREILVDGQPVVIRPEDWLGILKASADAGDRSMDLPNRPVDNHVRDCFDALFYYMAVLNHYLERRFILFEDIEFPLSYYVKIMAEDRAVYVRYVDAFKLSGVETFLRRFKNDWPEQPAITSGQAVLPNSGGVGAPVRG